MAKIEDTNSELASLFRSNKEGNNFHFFPFRKLKGSEKWRASKSVYIRDKDKVSFGEFNSKMYSGCFKSSPVCVKNISGVLLSEEAMREDIDFVGKVAHKNILTQICATVVDFQLWIVTESRDVSLYNAIVGKKISAKSLISLCEQCALGMEYLHSQGVVHGNLQPSNVLIYESSFVKLSDFGMTNVFSELVRRQVDNGRISGVVDWFAPELLRCIENEKFPLKLDFGSDIFSLGCVFFYIASYGLHPFGDILERFVNITKGCHIELENRVPQTCANILPLISLMISNDVLKRPTASKVTEDLHAIYPANMCAQEGRRPLQELDQIVDNAPLPGISKQIFRNTDKVTQYFEEMDELSADVTPSRSEFLALLPFRSMENVMDFE